ncbi:WhiB family transcriptional regulator [Paeniglutamicibacter psychrophenolicus]|uniref:WhiB family transcriptional regulator n=1 Tax=Paeniglutamicibacter psychrophenolicus TaxID=257454 RepID=UPI0027868D42|nr:WhiB family transcriptional regulator [Paeniglutamicibacter psychrophenolicus]MDQ0092612.1 WhiB family redox-sensing transcriptional regulator [Paeniglutamicibacter psychrophenolicus]
MGNVDRSFNEAATTGNAPNFNGGRGVPADWFVDPAAPGPEQESNGSRVLTPAEETAAFLAAHDAANDLVTEPTPSWAPSLDASANGKSPAQAIWIGLGSEDEEGELGWQSEALCAQTDPEAFFPEKGGSTRDAKRVCGACNVRSECLEYALTNDERFGIWGGLSERERRRLRKRAV